MSRRAPRSPTRAMTPRPTGRWPEPAASRRPSRSKPTPRTARPSSRRRSTRAVPGSSSASESSSVSSGWRCAAKRQSAASPPSSLSPSPSSSSNPSTPPRRSSLREGPANDLLRCDVLLLWVESTGSQINSRIAGSVFPGIALGVSESPISISMLGVLGDNITNFGSNIRPASAELRAPVSENCHFPRLKNLYKHFLDI